MEGRKRPVAHALDMAVVDRVVVDVVDVAGKIAFVTQSVFPTTARPDPAVSDDCGTLSRSNSGPGIDAENGPHDQQKNSSNH